MSEASIKTFSHGKSLPTRLLAHSLNLWSVETRSEVYVQYTPRCAHLSQRKYPCCLFPSWESKKQTVCVCVSVMSDFLSLSTQSHKSELQCIREHLQALIRRYTHKHTCYWSSCNSQQFYESALTNPNYPLMRCVRTEAKLVCVCVRARKKERIVKKKD